MPARLAACLRLEPERVQRGRDAAVGQSALAQLHHLLQDLLLFGVLDDTPRPPVKAERMAAETAMVITPERDSEKPEMLHDGLAGGKTLARDFGRREAFEHVFLMEENGVFELRDQGNFYGINDFFLEETRVRISVGIAHHFQTL